VLGDEKYLAAIRNAWDMIEETQQWSSGGWGPKEAFVPPHEGKLGEALTTTRDHFETPCGCYAHIKLARYLLRFTADGRYGDGLERILWNTILGARDPDNDGNYFYYSDYQAGARKGYYHRKWSCCSGTLAQGVADYPIDLYFQAPRAIYVVLYTPSEIRWRAANVPVMLRQSGSYPQGNDVRIAVDPAAAVECTVHLRVPRWLDSAPEIRVNGKRFDAPVAKGFAALRRRWKKGDAIEMSLPLRFREEPVDDRHPNLVANMKGPLLYVKPDGGGPMMPFHAVTSETYTTYLPPGGMLDRNTADD